MPPVDLSAHLNAPRLRRLAAQSGLPLDLASSRAQTGWVTLSLLLEAFERGG